MPSVSLASLQLPTFTPLEPLTNGTNLPPVRASDLDPIEAPPKPIVHKPIDQPTKISVTLNGSDKLDKLNLGSTTAATKLSSTNPTTTHIEAPPSPGKTGSMRHFLSRRSMQSVQDDKSSIFSASPSTLATPDAKRSKRSSWWKRSSKRQSVILPVSAPTKTVEPVQSSPPPPRLPDDLFGKNLSTLDGDMFKNMK